MNLALRDIRRHKGRFLGTAVGIGLLFAVVIGMQGIYAGIVEEATLLTRWMNADLWIVQRDTKGPFAESSRLDSTIEARVAAVPGVREARSYTYQYVQKDKRGTPLRFALVGLSWPDDDGSHLPYIAGRPLSQPHGEIVADVSAGLDIGEKIRLGDEVYRVVGLTRNFTTSSGDAVVFLSIADSQLVAAYDAPEGRLTERQRAVGRLDGTELVRLQPLLADLMADPRWRPPALPGPQVNAVLASVAPGHDPKKVLAVINGWGDVTAYTQPDQEVFLLQGVVQRSKMQLRLFSIILSLTAAAVVMMVQYNLVLERTHELAVLKLMGAPTRRLIALVLQEGWLLGAAAYLVAFIVGQLLYPYFPRRVLLTPLILGASPIAIFLLTSLASTLGAVRAIRVDPARVLEG